MSRPRSRGGGGPREVGRGARPGGERAATVVEYSLLVALFTLVLLGGIELVGDGSSDELADRGAVAGAPDLVATEVPATTTGPPLPPTTTVTEGPIDELPADLPVGTAGGLAGCWTSSGSTWSARFDLQVTEPTGEPIPDITIHGTVTITDEDGGVRMETISGTSTADGTVVITKQPLASSGNPKDRRVEFAVIGFDGAATFAHVLPDPGLTAGVQRSVPARC